MLLDENNNILIFRGHIKWKWSCQNEIKVTNYRKQLVNNIIWTTVVTILTASQAK